MSVRRQIRIINWKTFAQRSGFRRPIKNWDIRFLPQGLDGPIPRKKKKAKGADGSASTPSNKKQCNFCQQWSPQIAHTHNTAQCRKWNKDGTPKKASSSFTPAQKKAYQIAKSNEETKKVFMAMKKQQKALAKLLKKSQKKGKRKRKHYSSSSDDSSSGSESE